MLGSRSGCAIGNISALNTQLYLPNPERIQQRFLWTHLVFFIFGIPTLRRPSVFIDQTVTPDASEELEEYSV
ncbi:unnamed protein product [Hymenolepis diminuta]|uniref:Uncharacterized protein n=1 Tax=Hymenolepis diminuta TaxID=6216 RepID=A0A0R3SGC8_HYMDI|nr:unnamed protein product [Hymenolepis diminuta]VUZ40918.1 unnamed protein product [Hymenolepis diminuta]